MLRCTHMKMAYFSSFLQFEPSPQLCKLILNGVPQQYRAYIWQKLIDYYARDMRRSAGENYYYDLLKHQDIMKLDKVRENEIFQCFTR